MSKLEKIWRKFVPTRNAITRKSFRTLLHKSVTISLKQLTILSEYFQDNFFSHMWGKAVKERLGIVELGRAASLWIFIVCSKRSTFCSLSYTKSCSHWEFVSIEKILNKGAEKHSTLSPSNSLAPNFKVF